jgi:hypothetical protein
LVRYDLNPDSDTNLGRKMKRVVIANAGDINILTDFACYLSTADGKKSITSLDIEVISEQD